MFQRDLERWLVRIETAEVTEICCCCCEEEEEEDEKKKVKDFSLRFRGLCRCLAI